MSHIQQSNVLSEIKSNKNILPSLQEIKSQITQKCSQLSDLQKSGKYTEAEQCKENIQKLKKELQEKKIYDLIIKQKRQRRKMEKNLQEQMTNLQTQWASKIQQFKNQFKKAISELQTKQINEMSSARGELQNQVCNKMKQSAECLNLRKMEEQMVKQQQYAEAHKVQQRIIEIQKKEKEIFQKQRQLKIQNALIFLMNKQKTQKQTFVKKNKANENELLLEQDKEINLLKHKHQNIMKELKSQQEKEVLAQKGQIKSKVTVSAVKSKQKIVFNTTI